MLVRAERATGRTGGGFAPVEATFELDAGGRLALLSRPAATARALLAMAAGRDRPLRGKMMVSASVPRRPPLIGREHVRPSGDTGLALAARQARRMGGRVADGVLRAAAEETGVAPLLASRSKDIRAQDRLGLVLAGAAASGAPLVLLDDPLRDLAPDEREGARRYLAAAAGRGGTGWLLATDAPDDAFALGGAVAVFADGRLRQIGSARDILSSPADIEAARVACDPPLNTLGFEVREGVRRLADRSTLELPPDLASLPDGRYTLAFTARRLTTARPDERALRFAARSEGGGVAGARRIARLRFADASWTMLEPEGGAAPPGLVVNAFVDPQALLVFDAEGRPVR